jgi:hypothetical protein
MREPRFDPTEFDARLAQCSEQLTQIFAYLRDTALHSAASVSARPYVPKTGWGVTFYEGERWFCQLHPKREENYVQVLVHGAAARDLLAAGLAPADRADEQLWVPIKSMREAVRLVSFILAAANR